MILSLFYLYTPSNNNNNPEQKNNNKIIFLYSFCYRKEIKNLKENFTDDKKRTTIQWLSTSITELRNELAELEESSINISKTLQQKNQITEDINELRNDFQTIRLEVEALRSRQERSEILIKDLRDEATQNSEDVRRSMKLYKVCYINIYFIICKYYNRT